MTSAASIHGLYLLYIKKTSSKGTRSRDSTQFHRSSIDQSQQAPNSASGCNGPPRQSLLNSVLQLRNALPFPIRIRFHCPDSLGRFQKGTLFFIA